MISSNYSVIFVGHSEKDKYVQDNRYVIANLALASEDPNTNEKVYVKKHVLSGYFPFFFQKKL